jgi:hypothetical protein
MGADSIKRTNIGVAADALWSLRDLCRQVCMCRSRRRTGSRSSAGSKSRVLTRVAVLLGGGVLAGVLASACLSSLVSALPYEVEPRDAVMLVAAVLTLAAVAGLAASIPAYRASDQSGPLPAL